MLRHYWFGGKSLFQTNRIVPHAVFVRMNQPLLTILVPTFRRPVPLARCLASIEAADLPPSEIEIIVCDNASPDETPEVLAAHRSRHEVRYQRRNENIGALRNIRQGAGDARGTWVLFLTDDDRLDGEGARALLPVLHRRNELGYIVSAFQDVDSDERIVGTWAPSAHDQELFPGPETAATWGGSGWVISRLVFRRDLLDLAFWDRHLGNAYPSILFATRVLMRVPGLYLHRSLVDHAIGNVVHWEEFGNGQYAIWRKTHLDHGQILDIVFKEVGVARKETDHLVAKWRKQAAADFIAVAIYHLHADAKVWGERSRLTAEFGVPVGFIAWQALACRVKRDWRGMRTALADLLRRMGLKRQRNRA